MLLSNKPTVILYNIFLPLSTAAEFFAKRIPNKFVHRLLCKFTRANSEFPQYVKKLSAKQTAQITIHYKWSRPQMYP